MTQVVVEQAQLGQVMSSRAWGVYGLGLFVLGTFVSYMVQRYRRHHVCILAMLGVAAAMVAMSFVPTVPMDVRPTMLLGTRLAVGMLFGLSQMVLSSTLVIDVCESYQRTEANYAAAWFGRLSLALGPFVAILIHQTLGWQALTWTMVAFDVLAVMLVMVVDFPFRMPTENIRLFSLDRFLLLRAWLLFIILFIVSSAVGIVVALHWHAISFFAAMMVGFFLAILAEKFVFVNAELKSEAVVGMLLLVFAILMMWTGHDVTELTSAVCIGLGAGLLSSRFLLFFIKMSDHCQRGTSQSTYFLSWEAGLALGLAIGVGGWCHDASASWHEGDYRSSVLLVALAFVIVALVLYVMFGHQWYLKHKNR